jgi:hypothetical protein
MLEKRAEEYRPGLPGQLLRLFRRERVADTAQQQRLQGDLRRLKRAALAKRTLTREEDGTLRPLGTREKPHLTRAVPAPDEPLRVLPQPPPRAKPAVRRLVKFSRFYRPEGYTHEALAQQFAGAAATAPAGAGKSPERPPARTVAAKRQLLKQLLQPRPTDVGTALAQAAAALTAAAPRDALAGRKPKPTIKSN